MDIKRLMKHWKVGTIDRKVWSEQARQGSVVIQPSDGQKDALQAVVVDDYEGVRAAFQVPRGQIDELIAAAAKAWLERGTGGSFSVFMKGLKERGDIVGPLPPPPPPGGHERILMKQTFAAHAAFDAAAELVDLVDGGLDPGKLGQVRIDPLKR